MVDILDIALSSILFLSLKEKVLVRKELDSEGDFAVLSSERLSSIIGREVRSKTWTALRTSVNSSVQVLPPLRLKGGSRIRTM